MREIFAEESGERKFEEGYGGVIGGCPPEPP